MLPRRVAVERVARLVEGHVVGQANRQILLRDRHDAASLAMDDRDRAAPIALPGNAPVAQLVVDLPLRLRPVADSVPFEPARDLLLRLGDRHPVEEARIDHRPVAVVGGLVDDESRGIDAGRADDGRGAKPIDVDEVEVALVVRRAAEDRACAVVHENEVRDIDRQLPSRIEGMLDPHARVVALLLRRLDRRDRSADPCGSLR